MHVLQHKESGYLKRGDERFFSKELTDRKLINKARRENSIAFKLENADGEVGFLLNKIRTAKEQLRKARNKALRQEDHQSNKDNLAEVIILRIDDLNTKLELARLNLA